ncbi:putative Dilute domain-containing protein [Arabidopsis thaliana]
MSLNLYSVILRRECCSFSYGEYVKAGLAELEQWCIEATDEFAGSAWDELRHIRQAVDFLVQFVVLTIRQLFRISTKYWDNKYGTHSVSSDVIEKIRVMMTEDSDESGSFLLEDDSRQSLCTLVISQLIRGYQSKRSIIPFIVEDISMSMEQVNVNDIELPQLILENPCFSFLLTREEGNPS